MELALGLAPPSYNPKMIQGLDLNRSSIADNKDYPPKWVFLVDDNGGAGVETTALSLLHPKWRKVGDDECQVIEGWPPAPRKSLRVKVKMEGVGIGRKVDLRHYNSYQALTHGLIHMFAKYSKMDRKRSSEDYRVLYQDNDGDWMPLGDVEWKVFVESVQRVEILKNDNKMGFRFLSPKPS